MTDKHKQRAEAAVKSKWSMLASWSAFRGDEIVDAVALALSEAVAEEREIGKRYHDYFHACAVQDYSTCDGCRVFGQPEGA